MPRWTEAARLKQAELIRGWQPWTRSTGPRTWEGQRRSCLNSFKDGQHSTFAKVNKIVAKALGISVEKLEALLQIPEGEIPENELID